MSRLAVWGDGPPGGASSLGSEPSAQDQTQRKDTPAGRPVSISDRWQRDPAGQVGSIELLDAQYLLPRERDPRLEGDVRWKGSAARSAHPWRATPPGVRGRTPPSLAPP